MRAGECLCKCVRAKRKKLVEHCSKSVLSIRLKSAPTAARFARKHLPNAGIPATVEQNWIETSTRRLTSSQEENNIWFGRNRRGQPRRSPLPSGLILTHILQTEMKSKVNAFKEGLQREPD